MIAHIEREFDPNLAINDPKGILRVCDNALNADGANAQIMARFNAEGAGGGGFQPLENQL